MATELSTLNAAQRREIRDLVTHTTPPAVAGAFDDEFSDGVVAGAWVQQTLNFETLEEVNGVLHLVRTSSSANTSYLRKAFAPAGDFSLTTQISLLGDASGNQSGGMFIADAAGNSFTVELAPDGTVYNTRYNTWTGWASQAFIKGLAPENTFLRIRRVGATYYFEASVDGVYWFSVTTRAVSDIGALAWAGCVVFKNTGSYVHLLARWIRQDYVF